MAAAAGITTSGGVPTAVVNVQPGVNVQPVVLVDQNGQYVTPGGSSTTAGSLATTTVPVNVAASTAPSTGNVLTATSGTAATWQALPSGTTSAKGVLQLDGTASDIALEGTQTAGATGKAADAGHIHPAACWTPADSGLLAMNYDPILAGGTQITTAGTLYLQRVNIYKGFTWTNVIVAVTVQGNNTGGSTGTFVGLYNSSGTLLTGSSDVATILAASGTKTLALTTPQPLTAGTFVWAALLTNLGTTQPTLAKSGAASTAANANLAAASYRVATNGTALTSLPSPSITPGNNSLTGSQAFWVGAT